MKIGILGTGMVGEMIGTALLEKGHEVMIGSRTASNEKAVQWAAKNDHNASYGIFKDAVQFGDIIFLCVNGSAVTDVLQMAGADHFKGKIVIDLTNPLDFSNGFPPSLLLQYSNIYSLGEEVQKNLPTAKVVKALNTVTASLMINANLVNNGNHNLFICGNDKEAKNIVKHFLANNFNWKPELMIDMGDIKSARLTEGMIPFWVGVMQAEQSAVFNFMIVK
jgi:8-hydroxy-5-deazaflavin:NADPH oxidoreductase